MFAGSGYYFNQSFFHREKHLAVQKARYANDEEYR